jgi:hypothetical protein
MTNQPFQSATIPPLMPLTVFFATFGISKSLFYKLPPKQRPKIVRVGCKPMIRAIDAIEWISNLSDNGDSA